MLANVSADGGDKPVSRSCALHREAISSRRAKKSRSDIAVIITVADKYVVSDLGPDGGVEIGA
jgi:hypothetical protein